MILKASYFLNESENKKVNFNLKDRYVKYESELAFKVLKDVEDFFKKYNMKFEYQKDKKYRVLSYSPFYIDGIPVEFTINGYKLGIKEDEIFFKKIKIFNPKKEHKGFFTKHEDLEDIIPKIKIIKEYLKNTGNLNTEDFFET